MAGPKNQNCGRVFFWQHLLFFVTDSKFQSLLTLTANNSPLKRRWKAVHHRFPGARRKISFLRPVSRAIFCNASGMTSIHYLTVWGSWTITQGSQVFGWMKFFWTSIPIEYLRFSRVTRFWVYLNVALLWCLPLNMLSPNLENGLKLWKYVKFSEILRF